MNDLPTAVPVPRELRTGWASKLAKLSLATLLFEAVSGLVITFAPSLAKTDTGGAFDERSLAGSRDPSAGDALDYNRTPGDRKHCSHRFIAANTIIPHAQRDQLPGW